MAEKTGFMSKLSNISDEDMAKGSAALDGVMSAVGTVGGMMKDINMSSAAKMDERGTITHRANVGGKALSMAKAGGDIGGVLGPEGKIIGTVVGGVVGAVGGLMDKKPTLKDQMNEESKFQLGQYMKTVRAEDTFAEQTLAAKNGMKVNGDIKKIEVEKDEVVLRRYGKSFKKVADFKGKASHEKGGHDYVAAAGDIIIPGKDRKKVAQLMKSRRWSAVESIIRKLPTDTGQEEFKEGTAAVNPKGKGKTAKATWLTETMRAIDEMYPDATPRAKQSILANMAHETQKGVYTKEVPMSYSNIKARTDIPTITGKVEAYMAKNNLTPEQYDALPEDDRRSVQYAGDVGTYLAGGVGALQTTDVGGSKIDVMRKVGEQLGATDDKSIRDYVDKGFYESAKYSLAVLQAEGITSDKLNRTKDALDLRKQYINQGETNQKHLDSVVNYEKDVLNETKKFEGYGPTPTYATYKQSAEIAATPAKSKDWFDANVTVPAKKGRAVAKLEQKEATAQTQALNTNPVDNNMYSTNRTDPWRVDKPVKAKPIQLKAEDGMKVTGKKTIEVERDEVVLRKTKSGYQKVADFKGGKDHEDNGEQYTASDGDIVVPGAKRDMVLKQIRLRDWKGVSSLVAKLPTDTGQQEFEEGTDGVKTTKKSETTFGLTKHQVQKRIYRRLREAGYTDIAAKGIVVNFTYESQNFSKDEEVEPNQYGTKGLGIAQWTGPRRTALEAYLKRTGKKLNDVDAQVDFFLHEVKNDPGAIGKFSQAEINKAQTVQDSSAYFMREFEKPKVQTDAHVTSRMQNSKKFLATQEDKIEDDDTTPAPAPAVDPAGKINQVSAYSTYAEKEKAAGRTAQSAEWYKANVTDPAKKGVTEFNAAKKEEAAFDKKMRTDTKFRGMYHVNDAEGQSVVAGKNIRGALAGGPASVAGLAEKYANPTTRIYNLFASDKDKINLQEIGFSDKNLSKELDNFISYLQHDADITWLPMDIMRGLTALQNKVLTGQDIAGSIPNAIAEIVSGSSPEQFKALVEGAQKKGVLSKKSSWIVNNIATEPQNYWTSDMTANLGFDVATLVANPKGIINMVKSAGGLIKALGSGAQLKKLLTAAKGLPGATLKIMKSLKPELTAATKYQGVQSLDEMVALGKQLDAAGVPVTAELMPVLVKGAKPDTWSSAFTSLKQTVKNFPDAARQKLIGKSYTEINVVRDELLTATGKTQDQLLSMSKADVGALLGSKQDEIAATIEAAIKVKEEAIATQKSAKKGLTAARKELADLREIRGPKANEDKLVKALATAEEKFAEATTSLTKAYSDNDLYATNWKQIAKLEALESTPAYRDKFRTLVKMEAAIAKHVENLEDLGDTPEALKVAIAKHGQWANNVSEGIARVDNVKDAAGNVVKGEGKLIDALNNVTAAGKGVVAAGKNEKAVLNAGIISEANLAKVPGLLKIVEADAEMLKMYKDGALTAAKILNIARERGGDPIEMEKLAEEVNYLPPVEDAVPTTTPEGDVDPDADVETMPEVKLPETMIGVDESFADTELPGKPKAEIAAGETGGKTMATIGERAGEIFGTLAAYAPAFYNIARGLEPADKVARRFITPQTKKYESMAQPQLNAIDDAFNTSVGNARNASGGLMSNFRSNIEKSWADKLKRTSEVNALDAENADKTASMNIGIRNQAEQYNAQVNAQADQIDMQSEAATKSFMGQGMADIAAISGQRRADQSANKNQQMIMSLMGTGNFQLVDGKIVPVTKAAEAEVAAVTDPAVPAKPVLSTEQLDILNSRPKGPFGK